MDRKEAIRNISIVTGMSEERIEKGIDEIERANKAQSIPLTCFPDLFPKQEIQKPLTVKQYGIKLLNMKKKKS